MNRAPQQLFQEALSQVSEARSAGAFLAADTRLRAAFLSLGSDTDDNTQAIECIRVSEFASDSFTLGGLQLARLGASLSDVLNCAEGCSIPTQVQECYPDLKQCEWDAVLRVATMTLSAFEAPRLRETPMI